jgi:hypothetical protein
MIQCRGTSSLIFYEYPDLDVGTALLIREDSGEQDVRRFGREETSRRSPSFTGIQSGCAPNLRCCPDISAAIPTNQSDNGSLACFSASGP